MLFKENNNIFKEPKESKEPKEKKEKEIDDKRIYELCIFNRERQSQTQALQQALQQNIKPRPKVLPESSYKINNGLWEVIKNYQEVRNIVINKRFV
jgi:hypothetical protein